MNKANNTADEWGIFIFTKEKKKEKNWIASKISFWEQSDKLSNEISPTSIRIVIRVKTLDFH